MRRLRRGNGSCPIVLQRSRSQCDNIEEIGSHKTRLILFRACRETLNGTFDKVDEFIDIRSFRRFNLEALPDDFTNRFGDLDGARACGGLCLSGTRPHAVGATNTSGTLVWEAPVAAEDAKREGAARLVGAHLKGGLADETGVEGAAEGPNVRLGVDDGVGADIEELWGAVGHRRVLGGCVLDL